MMTINVPITLGQFDLDCIVDAGINGADYWYTGLKRAPGPMPKGADALSECVTRGCPLKFRDEDGKWFILDLPALKKGIELYVADIVKNPRQNFPVNPAEGDATVGDMVLQYALFGEVVYG